MAKELKEFPAVIGRGRRAAEHPLEKYLDGKIYQLDPGDDFEADRKLESVRNQMHMLAKRNKGKVKTAKANGDKSLIVQFFKA